MKGMLVASPDVFRDGGLNRVGGGCATVMEMYGRELGSEWAAGCEGRLASVSVRNARFGTI